MEEVRDSIKADKFPEFVNTFMKEHFAESEEVPKWIVEALKSVNIELS